MIVTRELMQAIVTQYQLPLDGVHGVSHWARVFEIGNRLATATGASEQVVQLFAVFHDSRRVNEGGDYQHGRRGAELAAALRGVVFDVADEELELLRDACERHTDGLTEADITVQTCWDSDRLDLGRVGIKPRPQRLCTLAAKDPDVLDWAYQRSIRHEWPSFVESEWGIKMWGASSQGR